MDPDLERDFTEFVGGRTPALFRTAMALTGNRSAAEDLLQTVLARTFLRWSDVRRGAADDVGGGHPLLAQVADARVVVRLAQLLIGRLLLLHDLMQDRRAILPAELLRPGREVVLGSREVRARR